MGAGLSAPTRSRWYEKVVLTWEDPAWPWVAVRAVLSSLGANIEKTSQGTPRRQPLLTLLRESHTSHFPRNFPFLRFFSLPVLELRVRFLTALTMDFVMASCPVLVPISCQDS